MLIGHSMQIIGYFATVIIFIFFVYFLMPNTIFGSSKTIDDLQNKLNQLNEEMTEQMEEKYPYTRAFPLANNGTKLNNQERYEEAIVSFDKALVFDPGNPTALDGKGTALLGLGKYQEAIEFYDKVLTLDLGPCYFFALNNKGLAYYEMGRYQEAIGLYDQALEILEKNYCEINGNGMTMSSSYRLEPLNNKGVALSALGRYQEAIGLYDQALALNPTYKNTLNNKGNALSELGKYEEAIQIYDKALELPEELKPSPGVIRIHNIGKVNELVKAVSVENGIPNNLKIGMDYNGLQYVASVKGSETIIVIHINKGIALYDEARYNEANSSFDKVLKIDSNFAPGLYYKGLCMEKLGYPDEAISYKQKANEVDPIYKGERLDRTAIQIPNLPLEALFTSQ